jgi:hypothetical protein
MTADTAIELVRAAKPQAHPSSVDADALFDRITIAAPGRSRGARRRRPLFVFAVALALVAVIASTALAISGWLDDIGPAEVHSEFTKAEQQLQLPPGFSWPRLNVPANSVTSRGAGGAYAVNMAQSAWECYWAQSIRSRNVSGENDARAALSDLMKNHVIIAPKGASENWAPPPSDKPVATYADDGGYQYKQHMYAAAEAGDPQLLEQSCEANGPRTDTSGGH